MNNIKRMRNERGFTLIELLVVIVILGILAAVVVFAVGGLSDKGNTSACKIDTRTLRTAEEAFSAQQNPAAYATQTALVTAKLLSEESTLHGVREVGGVDEATDPPTTNFEVYITAAGEDKGCGTEGNTVGQTAADL